MRNPIIKPGRKPEDIKKATDTLVLMPRVLFLEGALINIGNHVKELEHDFKALAELTADQLGEPFRSEARKIVDNIQTRQGHPSPEDKKDGHAD